MAPDTIFSYFVGGLALLSTLFSMLVYLHIYLPGPRLKAFDEMLAETKTIYERVSTEGLLPPEMSRNAQAQLREYEDRADDFRAITYRTLSTVDLLLSSLGRHSSKIADLSSDLKELRLELLTTSQKERARRRESLLTQERAGSADSTLHSMVDESDSEGDKPECCCEPESTSHPTTENMSATSSTSANRSSVLFEIPYSAFRIGSLTQWLSRKRPSPSPSQSEGENYDPSTSLSEIEPYNRSSTLVEDPLPKGPSDRPWSRLARWVRPADTWTRREDLEATLSVSNSSISHNSGRTPCEP